MRCRYIVPQVRINKWALSLFKFYRLIQLYTFEKEVILDPFVGSDTTCIAALKTKRHYVGYDNLEEYVELAKRRIKLFLQEQLTLFNNSKAYSK